jgi:hypothetical protein
MDGKPDRARRPHLTRPRSTKRIGIAYRFEAFKPGGSDAADFQDLSCSTRSTD